MPAPSNKSASAALPVGYRLGEYAIEAVLGQGGFGITYRARDTRLGAQVAIKEYFPQVYAVRTAKSTIVPGPGADLENYRWGLSEFLKEAQALAKFKHPHIVRVLRFLEANGTAYTIMEYEQGQTLAAYLARHGGVLDEAALLRLFLPVLSGLEAVHEAGLLHLDIKPENIYLRANEQPMLIDFGSSRQMRGETGAQKVTLTPGYCALEQYPGYGEVGPWSDVYGIGAALYRCITGECPVDALERHHTFQRTHADALRPATAFERPFYAAHIRQCVDAALKLPVGERPGSAFMLQQGLMGKDMAQVGKRRPDTVFRPGTGYIGAMPTAPVEEKKPRKRSRSLFESTIALLVVAATFAVITPMTLIHLGRMTDDELYDWIDETKTDAIARANDVRDWINERVFGVKPLPRPPVTVARRRAPPPAQPAAEPPALRPPFPLGEPPAIEIAVPGEPVRAIGFLQHGLVLATASDDGLVRLWDAQTGTARLTLPAVAQGPGALGVFPSTQWLAAADRDSGIAVFDPLGNRESLLPGEPDDRIAVIAVSTAGRLLAAAEDNGELAVWELSQRRKLHALTSGKSRPRLLAFSPDERLLLAGDESGGIAAWDLAGGVLVSYRRAHEQPITAMAFSPDGRLLAVGAKDGAVRFWTAQDDAPARSYRAGAAAVEYLTFSRDGLWLLAASGDGAVHLWSADTGEPAGGGSVAGHGLRAFAATADGKLLAAAGNDNVVRIWR